MNRETELRRLLGDLRRIEGPTTDYTDWWADVRRTNARLRAAGLPVLTLAELARRTAVQ